MAECRSSSQPRPAISAARQPGLRDRLLIGLVAITLVRAGEALAAEQASETGAGRIEPSDARPPAALPYFSAGALGTYSTPRALDEPVFSKDEFRPHGPSVSESGAQGELRDDKLINDTTVWQRLSEFRTRDRVRVLTLWQSGLSAVSLQAGKKGSPSLQWTSRLMNSGEAAHGLLDRLLPGESSAGKGAAAGVAHPLAHAASQPPGARTDPVGKGAASSGTARPALP